MVRGPQCSNRNSLRGRQRSKYEPLAKELVATQPDVILAHTTQVAAALQRESRVIPIVFVNVSDPIGSGFVASLARPGGNFTGVLQYEASVVGKWLAMLKEIAPRLERVALVANPKTTPYDYFLRAAEAAAPSLAIKMVSSPVATAADIEQAIDSFAGAPNGGLLLPPDATTVLHRDLIIALAAKHKLPAVYAFHFIVAAGGLMSYGIDQAETFQAGCVLCRPHPARRQTRQSPSAGPNQIRNNRQLQNGEGTRYCHSAGTAGGRRRGDRISGGMSVIGT